MKQQQKGFLLLRAPAGMIELPYAPLSPLPSPAVRHQAIRASKTLLVQASTVVVIDSVSSIVNPSNFNNSLSSTSCAIPIKKGNSRSHSPALT